MPETTSVRSIDRHVHSWQVPTALSAAEGLHDRRSLGACGAAAVLDCTWHILVVVQQR